MTFTVIDCIFGLVIFISAIVGLCKGFIDNIFGKLSWILAILSACIFYDDISTIVLKSIENPILSKILGFILIFIVVFLFVKIVQMIISKIFEWNILKSLDRTLGFFFGLIEGFVIVAVIIFIITVQPFFPYERLFEGSFFYDLLNNILFKAKEVSINV